MSELTLAPTSSTGNHSSGLSGAAVGGIAGGIAGGVLIVCIVVLLYIFGCFKDKKSDVVTEIGAEQNVVFTEDRGPEVSAIEAENGVPLGGRLRYPMDGATMGGRLHPLNA